MKRFLMTFAAMLLVSVGAFAQSENTPIKGDVNDDGKVDVADIAAIIAIMKNGGGTGGQTTYYWYIGLTDPSTMTEISPIVTDTNSPGWRLIGTTLPTYNSSNMLWNGVNNEIEFSRNYHYVALPSVSIKIWNGLGGEETSVSYETPTTKTINDTTYYIYKSLGKTIGFGYNIY